MTGLWKGIEYRYAKNAAQPVSQEVCPPYGGTDFLSAGSRKKKQTIFSQTNLNPARKPGFVLLQVKYRKKNIVVSGRGRVFIDEYSSSLGNNRVKGAFLVIQGHIAL